MSAARLIVITHEHPDHIGGLAAASRRRAPLSDRGRQAHTRANGNPIFMKPVTLPPGILAGYEPLVYDRYAAIAPGVVLIKAPATHPAVRWCSSHEADGTGSCSSATSPGPCATSSTSADVHDTSAI